MRRRRFVLGLLVALALVASACGGSSDDGEGTTDTVAESSIRTGGSATVITPEARSLDPAIVINQASQGSNVLNALYDVLYTVDPDTNAIEPRMATDFTSPDGLTWTLTLRDGLTFSDGTPFDAEAVKFNWERSKTNVRASSYAQTQQIESMTATSPTTLEVVLNAVNRQFFQAVPVLSLAWIASPASIQAGGEAFGTTADAVGAGPFKVQSRNPNVETVFVRNDSYWQEGLPKLDQLTMRPIPDQQQATDSVTTGAAEAYLYPTELLTEQAVDQGMRSVVWNELQGGTSMLFNQNKPPFDDIKARQAVTLAIDVQQMIDVVAMGSQEKIEYMFQESSPFYNEDYRFPETNPEEAQRLFDELAAENGGPLVFDMAVSTTSENVARVTQLQTQLAEFENVTMNINQIDGPAYGTTLFAGDFNAAFYAVASPDPVPQFDQFSTTYFVPIGNLNSPEADEAIAEGKAAPDEAGRKAAYDKLQQVLVETYPEIWLYRQITNAIHQPSVAGIVGYGQGSWLLDGFGFVE